MGVDALFVMMSSLFKEILIKMHISVMAVQIIDFTIFYYVSTLLICVSKVHVPILFKLPLF